MRRVLILAVVLAVGVAVSSALAKRFTHHPECVTVRCAENADRLYNLHLERKAERRRERMAVATASYYDDSGSTASGEHAELGFAHLGPGEDAEGWTPPEGGLAMGTRVRFCAVRCVTATMDDHGPYVAGRSFDLSPTVKEAIGASDLGTVRYRILH